MLSEITKNDKEYNWSDNYIYLNTTNEENESDIPVVSDPIRFIFKTKPVFCENKKCEKCSNGMNKCRICSKHKSCESTSCNCKERNSCVDDSCSCKTWNDPGEWTEVSSCTESTTNSSITECYTSYVEE